MKILVSVVRFRPWAPFNSLKSLAFSFLMFEILLRFDGFLEGFDNFFAAFVLLFPDADSVSVLLCEVGIAGIVQPHRG